MNETRMNELMDYFAQLDDSETADLGFDMRYTLSESGYTLHPCGSACCIEGHIQELMGGLAMRCRPVGGFIAEYLDIPFETAERIALPHGYEPAWEATPRDVIRLLQFLWETGTADWRLAMSEGVDA